MADQISDPALGLAALLEWDEPIAIAFYPDPTGKAELVESARVLAPPRGVEEVRRGEDALALIKKDVLIILDPEDPRAAVQFMDRNRDHFEGENARLLLLLLRGGQGEEALQDAPALASFARSRAFDLDAGSSTRDAAAAFQQAHGMGHDEWLRRWRSGELSDTFENNLVLAEALAIEGPS